MSDTPTNISEVIKMAWCDKTSFDDLHTFTGLSKSQTIKLMRSNLNPSSFRLWIQRVTEGMAKHKKMGALK